MDLMTRDDINYLIQQPSDKINMILSGMTALMNDTENKANAMESQSWFKRMIKTVTGKNKVTVQEIQQNHDKLNAYMAQAVAELYQAGCINNEVMISLSMQMNEIYTEQTQLKQMLGMFVEKLNAKINSVDNFNMLVTEIEQGMYSNEPSMVALCKVMAQYDYRVLEEERKQNILKTALEKQNIVNSDEIPLRELLKSLLNVQPQDMGQLFLELNTIRGNGVAAIFLDLMSRYYFLSDLERKMKNKDALIDDVIEEYNLDASIMFTVEEIYDSMLNSKVDVKNGIDPDALKPVVDIPNEPAAPVYQQEVYTQPEIQQPCIDEAAFDKAMQLYNDGQYDKAIPLLEAVAKQGHSGAMRELGDYYYYGIEEHTIGKQWYKKAVEYGDDVSATQLGYIANNAESYYEAVTWFRQAAEHGNAEAQTMLAFKYNFGQGVEKNKKEAFHWFMKAALQNDEIAQSMLGSLYYKGEGVKKDKEEAKKWLRRSVEQGYEGAVENLRDWFGESFAHIEEYEFDSIKSLCTFYKVMHPKLNFDVSNEFCEVLELHNEEIYMAFDGGRKNAKYGYAITDSGICTKKSNAVKRGYFTYNDLAEVSSFTWDSAGINADNYILAICQIYSEQDKMDLLKLFRRIKQMVQ